MKLSITTTQGELGPNRLLFELDRAITETIQANALKPLLKSETPFTLAMSHGAGWLFTAGRLAITGQNDRICLVPCDLSVGHSSEAIAIPVGFDDNRNRDEERRPWAERVFFLGHPVSGVSTKADLNYKIISEEFGRLFPTVPDDRIAQDIVMRMMGRKSQQTFNKAQREFIAGMVALMFGVEASRFPSSLATSLFLLDLIMYGKAYGREGTKKFTLKGSFHSTDWDNGEWYGGKYPYAVHGTGSGNMRMRSRIATDQEPNFFDNLLHLPQRHAVPRREVSLLIHWLEASLSKRELVTLTPDKVCNLIKTRLELSYVHQELAAPFEYSPRRFTGQHAYAPGQRPKLPLSGGTVFWFDRGSFYHIDPHCKTLPGYQVRPSPPSPPSGLKITKGLVLKPTQPSDLLLDEVAPQSGDWAALNRYGYKKLRPDQKRRIDKYDEVDRKVGGYGVRRSGSVLTARGGFNKKKACPVCIS